MFGRRLTALLLGMLPATALAEDGWTCTADSEWSMCAPGTDDCISHTTTSHAEASEREEAERQAAEACRQQTDVERLRAAWTQSPDQPPTHTRLNSACTTSRCTAQQVSISPFADAFDDPVCIQVRLYICELCGSDSPLCQSVRTEQPVTAAACSDTHVRLEAFSDFLGQVDSLQPGTWGDARHELCGQ